MYKSQGDVNFRSTDKALPDKAVKIEDGVIARGEVTGHSHRVSSLADASLYDVGNGKMFLAVGENGVSIWHEEHAVVDLPRGNYEITIDHEYSEEGERRVID